MSESRDKELGRAAPGAAPRPEPSPHPGGSVSGDPDRSASTGRCEEERGAARGWPGQDDADRLLDGVPLPAGAAADPGTAALVRLLAAAAEPLPGRPGDEQAVLDAFRSAMAARTGVDTAGDTASGAAVGGTTDAAVGGAGAGAVGGAGDARDAGTAGLGAGAPARAVRRGPFAHRARPRSGAGSRRVGRGVLVGGVVAAFALGGVAIAAQNGALPHPFHSGGTPSPSASVSTSAGRAGATDGRPGVPGTGLPTDGGTSPAAPGTGTVAPSAAPPGVRGLCKAYLKATDGGRTPSANALTRLAQAAGGADRVEAYCRAQSRDRAQPTSPGAPSDTSNGASNGASQGNAKGTSTTSADPTHSAHPTHPAQSVHPTHPAHPDASHTDAATSGNASSGHTSSGGNAG